MLHTLSTVGAVVLLSFSFLLIISSFSIGGISARIVMSGSMEPTIGVGSVVFLAAQGAYGPGEIVTFMSREGASMPTTHRITMAHADGSFVTRGDANDVEDFGNVHTEQILGRVFLVVPYLGYLLVLLKYPLSWTVLTCLLVVYVGYVYRKEHNA